MLEQSNEINTAAAKALVTKMQDRDNVDLLPYVTTPKLDKQHLRLVLDAFSKLLSWKIRSLWHPTHLFYYIINIDDEIGNHNADDYECIH